jgi:hypothetical protein
MTGFTGFANPVNRLPAILLIFPVFFQKHPTPVVSTIPFVLAVGGQAKAAQGKSNRSFLGASEALQMSVGEASAVLIFI